MNNLHTRILYGLIYVTIFIGSILLGKETYLLLIGIFGLIGVWEFSKMISLKGISGYLFFAVLFFLFLKRIDSYPIDIILIISILSSIFMLYQLFSKKNNMFSTEREKLGLLVRYPIFSFCFLAILPFYNTGYDPYIIISVLVIIWINDSAAFIVGKNFGKRKFFESVSPKKTMEGFYGGVFFSLIAAYVISLYQSDFGTFNWLMLGFIISVLGSLGDLVESKFKRQVGIKDSGIIMPGHGGILDRLDSLMFVAPFVYLYINFLI